MSNCAIEYGMRALEALWPAILQSSGKLSLMKKHTSLWEESQFWSWLARSGKFPSSQIKRSEDGKMAQQLRLLSAVPEDQGSIPRAPMIANHDL